jgi:hypothetical protein
MSGPASTSHRDVLVGVRPDPFAPTSEVPHREVA